jgi:hypothetical protein
MSDNSENDAPEGGARITDLPASDSEMSMRTPNDDARRSAPPPEDPEDPEDARRSAPPNTDPQDPEDPDE